MAYKTLAEWRTLIWTWLGTHVGTDNKRFTPDLIDAALKAELEAWQPLLPTDFQDNSTEYYDEAMTWTAGETTCDLRTNTARLLGVDIPGYTVELYGIGRDGMDYNAWVENKRNRPNLATSGVFLVCYSGKRLMISPTPTTNLTFNVLVRYYPAFPGTPNEVIRVPSTTIPFHVAMTSAIGKWGDLRGAEAQALQTEAINMLKTIMGVQDREKEQS